MSLNIMPVEAANQKRLTMLIHGRQGSGKTLLASSIAEGTKTLLLDTTGEWGVETLRQLPYASNLDVANVDSVDVMSDVYNLLESGSHEYGAVVLDSVTAIQSLFWRRILGRNDAVMMPLDQIPTAFEQRQWGQMLDMMREVIDFYFSLASLARANPVHVVMTAQSIVKEDRLGESSDALIRPALMGAAYDRLVSAPDYIVYSFIEEDFEQIADEPVMAYRVRIGPHPIIVTKVRTDPEKNRSLPPIVGDVTKRVTIPKLMKLFGKEL